MYKIILSFNFSRPDAMRISYVNEMREMDQAAKDKGEQGLTTGDILNYLPVSLKNYRENYDKIVKNYYHSIYII